MNVGSGSTCISRGRKWRPMLATRANVIHLWAAPIFLFLILPSIIVVPMAFTSGRILEFPPRGFGVAAFVDLFGDSNWMDSGVTSIKVAFLVVILATIAATGAALALREVRLRERNLFVALILTPMVIPVVVLALSDYQALDRYGLLGSWIGIALVHSVIATPYAFLTIQASLSGLDKALIRSARSLGAGHVAVFRYVYMPIMAPGILAGALFAFTVSFDETVIALFLAGPTATTLPVQMFTAIQWSLSPKIAAVSVLLMGLAVLALLVQLTFVISRQHELENWRGRRG